jgi:hypothetical protein
MPTQQFFRDRVDDVAEIECARLLGHARVVHDLEQQVPELVAQVLAIAARDRLGDFVGFLDGVRGDRLEALLEIPRTAAARAAQRRHQLEEARDVARRGHAGGP